MRIFFYQLTCFLAAAVFLLRAHGAYAQTADAIAYNGKIYTSNENQPWAIAIATRGKDIIQAWGLFYRRSKRRVELSLELIWCWTEI